MVKCQRESAGEMTDTERNFLPPDPKGEFRFEVSLFLINLLVAVSSRRETELEKMLRGVGLTLTRYRVLMVTARLGQGAMSDLAKLSAIERTTLTRAVDQLEQEGLVERLGADNDRRKVKIAMTAKGRVALDAAIDVARAFNEASLTGVSDETRRSMVRGLQQMLANLGWPERDLRKVLGMPSEDD